MKIRRTSILTGITREREVNITPAQLTQLHKVRNVRWLVPHLSPEERDFLITGNLPEDYDGNVSTDGRSAS